MKVLILENPVLGDDNLLPPAALQAVADAELVIAIPEGGEPICIKHRDGPANTVSVKTLKLPTAAERNSERAKEHLEARQGQRDEIKGEPPLEKAARVWDGVASP